MTEWPFAVPVCRDCGSKAAQVQRRIGVDGSPPLCNACCATYLGDDWLRSVLHTTGTRLLRAPNNR